MIDFSPDITFVIQIVTFVALWAGLKRLVFEPAVQVIDERRARTIGVREQASEFRSNALSAESDCAQRIEAVRHELGRETDHARHATEQDEHRILATARDQATALLKERRDQIRAEATAARSQLSGEATQLAQLIIGKVVTGGRS